MTTLAVLALVAIGATLVLLATIRGQHRAERMTAADPGYAYVDGGADGGGDSGCSPGSDGGGCSGDGGGGGD